MKLSVRISGYLLGVILCFKPFYLYSIEHIEVSDTELKEIYDKWKFEYPNNYSGMSLCSIFNGLKTNLKSFINEDAIIQVKKEGKILFSELRKNSKPSVSDFLLFFGNLLASKATHGIQYDQFLPYILSEKIMIDINKKEMFQWVCMYPELLNTLIYTYKMPINNKNLLNDMHFSLKKNSFFIESNQYFFYKQFSQEEIHKKKNSLFCSYDRTYLAEVRYMRTLLKPKMILSYDKKTMLERYSTTLLCLKKIQKTTPHLKIPKLLLYAEILPRMLFPDIQKNLNEWVTAWTPQEDAFAKEFISKEITQWYFTELQKYFTDIFVVNKN